MAEPVQGRWKAGGEETACWGCRYFDVREAEWLGQQLCFRRGLSQLVVCRGPRLSTPRMPSPCPSPARCSCGCRPQDPVLVHPVRNSLGHLIGLPAREGELARSLWNTAWRFFRKRKANPQCHPAIPPAGVHLQPRTTTSVREAHPPTCVTALCTAAKTGEHPKTVREWMVTVVAACAQEEIVCKHESAENPALRTRCVRYVQDRHRVSC